MISSKFINYTIIIFMILFMIFCKNADKPAIQKSSEPALNYQETKIGKVVFYLENSESMFGYVKKFTEYVDVVSELSEKPEFANERTPREFYFINGGHELQITHIGNNPKHLKSKLNNQGFKCGDITKSNLNGMFQQALNKAINDTIGILISDAIYDIKQPNAPFNALATEGKETRTKFIERLGISDMQTILIKLSSEFEGKYFYTTQQGKIEINQLRPFYIWIFGRSELLNKYFPEEYITHLRGYIDYARFFNIQEKTIPYQVVSLYRKGSYKPDHHNKNKLTDAEPDRHGQGFQFSVAVNFASLPFSDNYLMQKENYDCNLYYSIDRIEPVSQKLHEIVGFKPTHILTLSTQKNPCGNLQVMLKNVIPLWINQTDTNDETVIDTDHTFGFKFLTNAISEAYDFKNKGKYLIKMNIEISK